MIALVTGAGEELSFRVGIFRLVSHRLAPLVSTALHTAVTLASGNLALTLAAILLGLTRGVSLLMTGR